MLVEVVSPFRIRGIELTPGMKIDIPEVTLIKLAGRVRTAGEMPDLDVIEAEYFRFLKRHWELDELGPNASMDECRENVRRLDRLYRELHRQGRKVPVRLPVEKKQNMIQEELAL